MRKGFAVLSIALTLLMGSAVQAQPTPTIDFNIVAPTAGTISYAGGASPLVGTGIQVDNVVGIDTPANAGVTLDLIGGVLNFTSGAGTGPALVWGGGGSLTVNGGIGAPLGLPAGTLLLSGTFISAQVINFGVNPRVDVSLLLTQLNPALTGFYGLPGGFGPGGLPYNSVLNLSFNIGSGGIDPATGAFTTANGGAVLSGDLNSNPVPEPASMVLLGIGAVGAFVGYRRRLKVAV